VSTLLHAGFVLALGHMAMAPLLHTFYINDFSKQLHFLVFDSMFCDKASQGWLCAAR
jgi:hypothetical protein